MPKNNFKLFLSSFLILGMFSFAYFNFAKYQPKSLRKVEEVKGLSSINTDDTPYPDDAVKIGFNQTPNSKQTVFRTQKTQDEVQEFYKNIFSGKEWKLISEKQVDGTLTSSYRKEKEVVTIVVTQQESGEYTTVSIETLKK